MHAVGQRGRHIFWSQPVRPSGRLILLGQATNRLLDLPISAITNAIFGQPVPEEQRAAVETAASSPVADEAQDLATVKAFFVEPAIEYLKRIGRAAAGAFRIPRFGGGLFGISLGQPLFQRLPSDPLPLREVAGMRYELDKYFGIDKEKKWGDEKSAVRNAEMFVRTLGAYPLPAPISVMPGVFYDVARDDMRGAVRYGRPIDPDLARFVITLVVLQHYNNASAIIVEELEEREEKRRRRAIIQAVVLGAVSLIMPAALGAGLAAIKTVVDVQKAREAAKDLAKAAKQFAETDAAFAAEVDRVAEITDAYAAQEERRILTEAEAEALAEPAGNVTPEKYGVLPPPEGAPGPSLTELAVGGGIAAAAAGLVALLV